jgi:uncharacterized protein (DUF1684 family)
MQNIDNRPYLAEIEAWRRQREVDLRAPDSWLSLTGLFVLADGCHTIGSALDNDIVLPSSAPARLGEVEFQAGKARLTVTTAEPVLVDGAAAVTVVMRDNSDRKSPTLVAIGPVTFFLHNFGDHHGIRVKDRTSPAIAAFGGCRWFPVKPEYRVPGRLTRYAATDEIPIETSARTAYLYHSIGFIDFVLQGEPLRLLVQPGGAPGQLSVVLRDATANQETYAPGRFLTVTVDEEGVADVDFNKAYNPPCAFTPYATCPLPPPANILPVRIEAGELYPPASGEVNQGQG